MGNTNQLPASLKSGLPFWQLALSGHQEIEHSTAKALVNALHSTSFTEEEQQSLNTPAELDASGVGTKFFGDLRHGFLSNRL